jgi:hypothetical protein
MGIAEENKLLAGRSNDEVADRREVFDIEIRTFPARRPVGSTLQQRHSRRRQPTDSAGRRGQCRINKAV